MTAPSKKDTEAQKRQRDITGLVGSAAVTLVTTFIYTRAIVATVFLALAIYFLLDWSLTFAKNPWPSKVARVRFQFVFTTVLVMFGWHFYFDNQYHEQLAAAVEGVLTPEKAPLNKQAIILVADDGPTFNFTSDSSGPSSLPPGVYRPDLQAREGPKGVLLTTSVKDRDGHLIVAIKDNHWTVYPQYSLDKNYTCNSLEVEDSTGDVVLQVVLTGSTAHVQGIWRDQFGAGAELISDENDKMASVISWTDGAEEKQKEQRISPSFIYPSSQHWGEKIPKMTVDDFDLSQKIDVINRSSEPLIALKVTVATVPPTFSYTRDLNAEVDPNKMKNIKLSEYFSTLLPPTPESFEEQWKEAKNTYKNCAGMVFFGATNPTFGFIIQRYRAGHLPVSYGDAVGVLTYKSKRSRTILTTHFQLVAFLTRIRDCQP